jgi:hypothetical protein
LITTRTYGVRSLATGVGLVAALALPGCSDNPTSPGTAPTPAPSSPAATPTPGTTVVLSRTLTLPARSNITYDFATTRRGTLDVEVGYSAQDSQILVFLTNKPCTYWQFERDQCDYLAKSLSGSTPRTLTVAGVAAGEYSLIILNENKELGEAMSVEVVLNPQ